MSNKILTAVWGASRQTGPRLLIMLSLADQANDNGECWPSYESIAQRARMCRRQAIRLIVQMSKEPRPEVTFQKRRLGKINSSNVFTVHTENLGGSDTAMSLPLVTRLCHQGSDTAMSLGGDTAVSLGVVTQLCHQGSDTAMSPEPKENPNEGTHREPPPPSRKVRGFSSIITEHADPRVSAYLTTLRQEITQTNAENILARVKIEQLDTWKTTLTLWAVREYNRTDFGAIIDRYETAANGKTKRAELPAGAVPAGNGRRPATSRLPQVADPTPAEYAAAEDRARAQRQARRAGTDDPPAPPAPGGSRFSGKSADELAEMIAKRRAGLAKLAAAPSAGHEAEKYRADYAAAIEVMQAALAQRGASRDLPSNNPRYPLASAGD